MRPKPLNKNVLFKAGLKAAGSQAHIFSLHRVETWLGGSQLGWTEGSRAHRHAGSCVCRERASILMAALHRGKWGSER